MKTQNLNTKNMEAGEIEIKTIKLNLEERAHIAVLIEHEIKEYKTTDIEWIEEIKILKKILKKMS